MSLFTVTNTTKYQKMEKDLAVFLCVCIFFQGGLPKSYFNFSNLVILSIYQQDTFSFTLVCFMIDTHSIMYV